MQVNDQVKLKRVEEGDEESLGRAGIITKIDGDAITVMLDETTTHEGGAVEVVEADLEFLGR